MVGLDKSGTGWAGGNCLTDMITNPPEYFKERLKKIYALMYLESLDVFLGLCKNF